MKVENRKRLNMALLNAAEMIRGHVEVGLFPEDVSESNQEGLEEYRKATIKASKMIETLAKELLEKNPDPKTGASSS